MLPRIDFLMPVAVLLCLAIVLSACTTTGATPKAVCDALLSPIKYNSADVKSARHAGPALAPDLAQHNRVGINLACPAYRIW